MLVSFSYRREIGLKLNEVNQSWAQGDLLPSSLSMIGSGITIDIPLRVEFQFMKIFGPDLDLL